MKTFISGGITGLPHYNIGAFRDAEIALSLRFETVFNPASYIPMYNPGAFTHEQYMTIALAMLACCDKVYFLNGWDKSPGSRMEFEYATEHHKIIEFEV